MNQKNTLLRKENDLLNSLIGQSFNKKSKFEAEKILNEIHSIAQDRTINKKALCYILDKNEIKGVGGSTLIKDKNGKIVSNLILDQFGIMLAAVFKFFGATSHVFTIKDELGVLQSMRSYSTANVFNNLSGNQGQNFQVGSGTTPPARTDFVIETPFGTPPESSAIQPTTNPVYVSGLGNFKTAGLITAGGSGTINESVMRMVWEQNAAVNKMFILFRDIISPAQAFVAAQAIALEYTIQM